MGTSGPSLPEPGSLLPAEGARGEEEEGEEVEMHQPPSQPAGCDVT